MTEVDGSKERAASRELSKEKSQEKSKSQTSKKDADGLEGVDEDELTLADGEQPTPDDTVEKSRTIESKEAPSRQSKEKSVQQVDIERSKSIESKAATSEQQIEEVTKSRHDQAEENKQISHEEQDECASPLKIKKESTSTVDKPASKKSKSKSIKSTVKSKTKDSEAPDELTVSNANESANKGVQNQS